MTKAGSLQLLDSAAVFRHAAQTMSGLAHHA